jgi:hypothetical protein
MGIVAAAYDGRVSESSETAPWLIAGNGRRELAWCDPCGTCVPELLYREAFVQQDKSGNAPPGAPLDDVTPDSQDRIRDFLSRHGGQGAARREAVDAAACTGWYEVYAADGLRCDWSRMGSREELKFCEIGPRKTEGASDHRF